MLTASVMTVQGNQLGSLVEVGSKIQYVFYYQFQQFNNQQIFTVYINKKFKIMNGKQMSSVNLTKISFFLNTVLLISQIKKPTDCQSWYKYTVIKQSKRQSQRTKGAFTELKKYLYVNFTSFSTRVALGPNLFAKVSQLLINVSVSSICFILWFCSQILRETK